MAHNSCAAEHAAHGGHSHGHSHGHGDCDHDDDPERGFEHSLLPYIDIAHVTCGNEAEQDSIKNCFRPWAQRADPDKFVQSDADEQLLVFIPFTGQVKLKSIHLICEGGEARPTVMKAFKNRDDIDFEAAEDMSATQEWDLVEAPTEDGLEYETQITKFQGIHNLTLFFPENAGSDFTKIKYIGLKGECKHVVRRTLITIGEFAANPADHKTKTETKQAHQFGY
eukprot:m.67133 g.67133  ORF g.67133 m.67133 type:complete len:224 (+) comp11862_c2_seq1:174-845(+)